MAPRPVTGRPQMTKFPIIWLTLFQVKTQSPPVDKYNDHMDMVREMDSYANMNSNLPITYLVTLRLVYLHYY